jgi:hypothetical protein
MAIRHAVRCSRTTSLRLLAALSNRQTKIFNKKKTTAFLPLQKTSLTNKDFVSDEFVATVDFGKRCWKR